MNFSIPPDVAGPGLAIAVGGSLLAMCIASGVIILIESLVLWRLHWGSFKRSLLVVLVANLVTTILGVGVVPFTIQLAGWGLLVDFALSFLVEGGILMLFKRAAARENWRAALLANIASYLLVILPGYFFLDLLK